MQEGTDPPEAFVAEQVAALAAGAQNKLWDYIEEYYRLQLEGRGGETDTCYVVPGFPRVVAAQVPGLDLARWKGMCVVVFWRGKSWRISGWRLRRVCVITRLNI